MAVATILLGGLAVWQGSELATRGDNVSVLTKRVATLKSDLQDMTLREQAAERRARVAEDSLSRQQSRNTSEDEPLAEARAKLGAALAERDELESLRTAMEDDLGKAIRELEALRGERDALKNEAAAAASAAADARSAATRASEAAETARKELSDVKSAAQKVPDAPIAAAPAVQVPETSTEALAPSTTGALSPTSVDKSAKPEEAEQKSAAITIEPDPDAAKAEAAKSATDLKPKSKPDAKPRAERKPEKKAQAPVAKKPKPSASSGEASPFFPF